MITKLTSTILAATMLTTQVWAGCMGQPEKTALKIETLQQELMVAGLTCNDANPYNAFVVANRPELIQSDHDLQAFYSKLYDSSGTDQFQTVKTRLANHFSLDSLHNQRGFCQTAAALFGSLHNGSPLATQVNWIAVNDTKESCERGAPIVETVDGGSSGLPQTQTAQAAPPPQYQREADNDVPPVPSGYAPPPGDQRAAQNYYAANYPAPRGYYAPPPNPYYPAPPSYNYPPPGYRQNGW
jgi:hypothetical protein